ncbi:hypothetical protein ADIAL_1422 [Alkalibacterium sp. AK22]|uniref:DUF6320 domain-containing protein n=1 Tax=Alkalibacterium sp. AK22 TaxID=1229520 RepID=UPI00044A7EA0|nr:DUF6320 domain-containing protein [Alkalibacterium sp. AK22]EXJ23137.1 hypothetical protein ADIAL_1422 [Alkalibacterium sp. AK22]
MKYCSACRVDVRDNWSVCPLCGRQLTLKPSPDSAGATGMPGSTASGKEKIKEHTAFPEIGLRFQRKKVKQLLTVVSLFAILLYFVSQSIWRFRFFGLEFVLFGLMVTWIMAVVLIRKRRNIVKGIVYVLVIFSLLSLYFDYIFGWLGWSLTFAIPILCIAALLAMFVMIQVVRLQAGDYILYLQLAALMGLLPLLFILMDWVVIDLPSWFSVLFSFLMFWSVLLRHKKAIWEELTKRMHV